MTDPGVPHDDMLSFLWRSRMDIPQIGDEALDALLAQDRGPGETAAPLRPVADVLAALREAPSHGELTGLDPVLAEFRGVGGMPDGFHRSRRRRPALLRTLLSVKVAGAVPAAVQKIAHNSIAAPAASAKPSPHQTHSAGAPVGPDPAGRAAHGLCAAYSHTEAQGSAAQQAAAFRKLAATAGGGGKVAAYCASAPRPGAGAHGKSASHATGRTTSRPGHTPAGKHKGKAASR
jgi:hypothetical protein